MLWELARGRTTSGLLFLLLLFDWEDVIRYHFSISSKFRTFFRIAKSYWKFVFEIRGRFTPLHFLLKKILGKVWISDSPLVDADDCFGLFVGCCGNNVGNSLSSGFLLSYCQNRFVSFMQTRRNRILLIGRNSSVSQINLLMLVPCKGNEDIRRFSYEFLPPHGIFD